MPPGFSCRILVRQGRYREHITIKVPVEVIGVGKIEKIVIENDAREHATQHNVRNVPTPTIIRNLTLYQRSSKDEVNDCGNPHFCVLLRSGDILLEDNILVSESCSTICVQHDGGLAILRGNAITGKSAGISIFKCRPDFTVDGNDIHHTVFSGIEIRQGTNPLIVRNKIHHSESTGILAFNNTAKGYLVHNDIFENVLSGVDISRGASPILKHNQIRGSSTLGVHIHGGGNGVVKKNEIYCNEQCNVYLFQAGTPAVVKNKIHTSNVGLSALGGSLGEIIENEVYNNHAEGIGILDKSNPLVKGNKVHDNGKSGIVVSQGGLGKYEHNEMYNNLGGGLLITQRELPEMVDNIIRDKEIVPDEVRECIDNNKCTFHATKSTFKFQPWYFCDTCAPQKDLGCCESCAKVCHVGHNLSERKFSPFFCDCGNEWKCKLEQA